MAEWKYLTSDELIKLCEPHGVGSVIKPDGLRSALIAPAQTFDGQDLHPEIADKAAMVGFGIAKIHHPFLDGNKRAGAIGMLTLCYINGFVPMITQTELVALFLLIAKGEATQEELAEFLRDRMT